MNADTLLENFEILAEAPDGINRLRELILQLATNGKLLNTSARNTNPATGLPETWMLQPFNEVAQFAMGKTPPTKNPDFWGGVNSTMWVSIGDMQDGQTIKESNKTVSLKAGREVFRREPWPEGTLLMSFKLTIGKMARLGNPSFFNEAIFAFDAGNEITNEYLFRVLPLISRSANSKGAIKGNTLNSESISQMRVPVPPLNEQERIVAKVDELMALCDQLEQIQRSRDNLRIATRKSAIDAISTATTPEELETAWKRINNNWEVVADTPESVESLRALILELAVSGRFGQGVDSWDERTLGQVAKIRTGKLDANASSPYGEYPFFTCAKSPLKISTFSYDTECVLLAGNGNFDVNYYSGKFDAYQRTYIIEAKNQDELFIPYLFRFMQGHAKKLLEQSIGGVIKYIKIGFLTDAPIFLPSYSEQKQIVSKVDELMELCDQLELDLKARSALAEKFARSVVSAA